MCYRTRNWDTTEYRLDVRLVLLTVNAAHTTRVGLCRRVCVRLSFTSSCVCMVCRQDQRRHPASWGADGQCMRGADTDKVIEAEECAHYFLVALHHHVYPGANALVHQLWGNKSSMDVMWGSGACDAFSSPNGSSVDGLEAIFVYKGGSTLRPPAFRPSPV